MPYLGHHRRPVGRIVEVREAAPRSDARTRPQLAGVRIVFRRTVPHSDVAATAVVPPRRYRAPGRTKGSKSTPAARPPRRVAPYRRAGFVAERKVETSRPRSRQWRAARPAGPLAARHQLNTIRTSMPRRGDGNPLHQPAGRTSSRETLTDRPSRRQRSAVPTNATRMRKIAGGRNSRKKRAAARTARGSVPRS